MFSRNGISLTFLLVSVCVLLVVTRARAECDCNQPESENTSERSGVGKFFHNTYCGAKGVAKKVSETVKDGYKYVKNKLSSDDKTQTGQKQPEYYDVDLRNGITDEPIKLANWNLRKKYTT